MSSTENDNGSVKRRATSAVKWSLATEAIVKVITPLTQIILAHILLPEAFGVVATVTMIISFGDMLSDAGFQKYLVQHEFANERYLGRSANVAFWTNFFVSVLIWLVISAFCDPLAAAVGCEGLGIVIVAAGASLPLTALTSVQLALYHRHFNFKDLLFARVAVALVPLFVTLPLALLGMDYWSMIVGTIAGNVVNAIVLTVKSSWKPSFSYSLKLLREMLSFSAWTLLESISIWLTSWVGTFILGTVLSSYYLGLYKTSTGMVNAAMGIITSATTPVLFAALSRCQDDEMQFEEVFFEMQKRVALFVIPLGIGIFVFRDFATDLLLGAQWSEAALLLGCWGLSSAFVIVLSHYASEVFRSKGRPNLSFLNQCVYLLILIPITYLSARWGFEKFAIAAAVTRLIGILIGFVFLRFVRFPIFRMCSNVLTVSACAAGMGFVGNMLLLINSGTLICVLWIVVCVVVYALLCLVFPDTRSALLSLLGKVKKA